MVSVLVVDDTPDRASELSSVLQENGFDVTDIAEPERLHAAPDTDVIIVDTRGSARTVLERLRTIADRSPRPIVMFSLDAYEALKSELDAAEHKLSERKLVERAKGILMKTRNLPEDQAYRTLQKLAMDKNEKIGDIARQVIDFSELLRT